jgi:hypothetical protein
MYYAKADSVVVPFDEGEPLVWLREDFNAIVDNFPSLHDAYPGPPDVSYERSGCSRKFVNARGDSDEISFCSEYGEDEYFALYRYFLKQRHQGEECARRRARLNTIYYDLSHIYGLLRHDWNGHNYRRTAAYVEYAVECDSDPDADYYGPTYGPSDNTAYGAYDISMQRDLFIRLLRQWATDEVAADSELDSTDRAILRGKVFRLIDEIRSHITSRYDLYWTEWFWRY